jgi:acyl-CoA synthetase (AMP-forming)/AMP-acid ligase II
MTTPADIRARLTGPGGEFEIVERDVRGQRLEVFANQRTSLRSWLDDSRRYGEREYLVDTQRRITFAQHADEVAALAAALIARGVRPGDRVAVLAANSADWVLAFWAITCAGGITVAGNAWWTAREAEAALERCAPRLVIADEKRAALLSNDNDIVRIEDLTGFASSHVGAALPDVPRDQDEPAVIMYTSGTTGRPKGAVHSHRNLLAITEYHRLGDALVRELMGGISPRLFLMSLPLFHIASLHNLALPRLASGDTVVVDQGRFDPDRVLGVVERERITNWAVVPTMAHRLVEADIGRYDLSSLGALSINSAPSSPALKERVRTAVPGVSATLADSYGLTEIGTAATVATSADLAQFPTSVGMPIATVRVEIRDTDGRTVPDGVDGEIWVRGQYTMLGYWADDAATAAMITADGWVRTGDVGSMRAERLYMAARRSDLILRGGENVYPAEIEAVLDEHPRIVESAVFGVEHADLGQEVAALVVTDLGEDDLRAYVAEQVAYYKVPSRWRITSQRLPRTATGKIVRSHLTDASQHLQH